MPDEFSAEDSSVDLSDIDEWDWSKFTSFKDILRGCSEDCELATRWMDAFFEEAQG